jgi:triosephosphate isomerase
MGGEMAQLIAGNWKMHGTRGFAAKLAGEIAAGAAGLGCEILVCPPFTALETVGAILAGGPVGWGGQDCHASAAGAHTGDISAGMLLDLGCRAVILGHSERRATYGDSDAAVRAKAAAAAAAGLLALVCVGETAAQRDAGHAEALVCGQVAGSLPDGFSGVVAYEPIWAIGTGRTPSVGDVGAMHAAIRAALVARLGAAGAAVRILYGGSVNAGNAAALLAVEEVGGALVGGASLEAASFLAIARAAKG